MNKILVITSGFDSHADIICPKIENVGVQVFRFNTDELGRYEINLRPDKHFLSIMDRENQKKTTAEDVSSIWYRRPSPDRKADDLLDDDGLKFFRGETKEWIKSITFVLKNSFWVTSPWLLYEARIKSNQKPL